MHVLEYIMNNADKLSECGSRREIYDAISKEIDAPVEEYQNSVKEMALIYQILKGIFEDGKMDQAKHVYEVIKKTVDEKC